MATNELVQLLQNAGLASYAGRLAQLGAMRQLYLCVVTLLCKCIPALG